MRKLCALLLISVFILSLASALELQREPIEKIGYDWDNVEQFTRDQTTSKYGRYEIRNSILKIPFLELSRVADIELLNNSDVCGENCFAEKEITLYEDGVLIDEVSFETLQEDGSWIYQPIRSYKFSYQGEIQDYKTVCVRNGTSENGTALQSCSQVEDGSHIGKINYQEGEVVRAGTYLLRLDGSKKPSRTVDWKVKTNGVWTDEWAVWGGGFIGSEYQLIIHADSMNESGLSINDVTVDDLGGGRFKINTTEVDDDLSRAKIMKTLFYGTNGLDPRATSTFITNPITIYSNDERDDGMIGYYAQVSYYFRNTGYMEGTIVGGSGNATLWAYSSCNEDGNGCFSPQSYSFNGSTVLTMPGSSNDITTDYTGTTTYEEYIGPNITRMTGGSGSFGVFENNKQIILSSGNISFAYTRLSCGTGCPGEQVITSTDFLDDEDFPAITYSNAQVTLNSPANNYISPTQEIEFNCSAEVTGGASLVNMSLWTNESGSWGIRNTITTEISGIGLVSYYTLDDNLSTTNVIDSLGLNNGTLTGGDNTDDISVAGKINTSLELDGSADYIDIGTMGSFGSNIDNGVTFSMWINTTTTAFFRMGAINTGATTLLSLDFNTGATGKIGITLRDEDGNILSGATTNAETWRDGAYHFIVITIDGSSNTINITIDNDSKPITYATQNTPDNFNNFGFGFSLGVLNNRGTPEAFFDGILDEVGIWNRTLNQSEKTSLYNSGDGNRPNIATTRTQTFQRTITESTLWNVQACDSDGDCGFAVANYTVHLDTEAPAISVQSPAGTLNYNFIGNNETLNITFTDSNLESCWYNYNGTNITIDGCLTGVKNSTQFILEANNFNMTIYANDSTGNFNSSFIEWDYKVIEINQTYNNETLEGAVEDFSATIRLDQGETITAVALVYNGSASAGTSSIVGNNIEINEELIIPQVTTETNITFYWSVILTGGEVINLTSQNQTVRNMEIDNCSSFSNQILNITMVDEEEQFQLTNTTIEVAINLLSVDRSQIVISLSGNFEDENPLGICLNENITEDIMYSLDAVFKYTSEGYAIEYYNLVNSSLDNETTTQSITLYNLNASDSTDFQLTFTGEDFLPVENALVFIERQYIAENTFKTVELPKTDSNGQTILHLVRNDIVYNIRVIKEGVVLANFANIIAFCEDFTIGACSLPLNAISNISLVFNYDDEIGLIFQENTQYNETTGVASFSFASTDGTTKVVSMSIERRDVFGNRTICENTVVSSSGSVSCQVDPAITDTSLISIISVDGEDKINSEIILDDTGYGQNGYAIFFIFSIAMLLMFSGSKTWMLVGVSLNYIVGVSLGLIIGGIAGVGSTGIFVLIISMVGIWQLNKDRKQ